MALLFDKENQELIVTCDCGCEEAIHIKIDVDEEINLVAFLSYMNGKFYNSNSCWETIKNKCKKIWAIIRNKDYYYSDVLFTIEEFLEFREYLNSIKINTMSNDYNFEVGM